MKIFSVISALLFGVFAYLQLNDPDPFKWVTVYCIVSLVCLLSFFGYGHKWIFIVVLAALLIMAAFYVPGFIEYLSQPNKNEIVGEMVYKKPYIEETREFLGLLMAATVIFVQYRNR